jgi:ribosomal protein S18 acetylase RimI-like enzyme
MAVNIRTATPADLPALGRLGALLVRAHHDFDAKRFIPATSETEAGYSWFLGTQLEKPNVAVLVADDDGEVVGYSYSGVEGRDYMSLRGPAGILYDVVVDPSRRNHGVGRQLVEAALGFLKNHGDAQRRRPASLRERRLSPDDDRDDHRADGLTRFFSAAGLAERRGQTDLH